jgi:hypothetical protein
MAAPKAAKIMVLITSSDLIIGAMLKNVPPKVPNNVL